MADNKDLYSRLKKLFSTGTVIRHVGKRKLRVIDTDQIQSVASNAMRDRYSRIHAAGGYAAPFSTVYGQNMAYQTQRILLFRDYDQMDCVSGNTKIPLLDGTSPTIKELSERNLTDPLHVFSYDAETNTIKIGNAHHIISKGIRPTVKITLDKGEEIICTEDHLIMLRDGQYKKASELIAGESVMPFYRKNFYKNGYRCIYNFDKGWESEHKIVAEQFDRELLDTEIVHHKNFDKINNNPDNLQIMDAREHKAFHMKLNNEYIWGPEHREKQLESIRKAAPLIKRHRWAGTRTKENNSSYGTRHTNDWKQEASMRQKEWMLQNKKLFNGPENPNYRNDITLEKIKEITINQYKNAGIITLKDIGKIIGCDLGVIRNRVGNWSEFKTKITSELNHKVISVETFGEIEVFDMTVEKYHNFATEHCFVHNCDPILATACDVYAEECTLKSEYGEILTINTDDGNIKDILHNLFYDILNIEHTLFMWIRNMTKYGDAFLFLEIAPEYGIHNVLPLSVYDTTRIEGENPDNPYYVYFETLGANGYKQKFENYEVCHFRLNSDSAFLPYGRCLKYDTYIDTDHGSKQIKDIEVGKKVWTYNIKNNKKELSTVLAKCNSGNKKIIKISTQHNFIEVSEEHPILVYDVIQKDNVYKQAKYITKNDLIFISSYKNREGIPIEINKTIPKDITCKSHRPKIDKLPEYVDEEFAEFCGFMIGDGWLRNQNNRSMTINFSLGIYEEQNKHYMDIMAKYTEKTIVVSQHKKGTKSRTARVCSKYFYHILKNMGISGNAHSKRVPEWVFNSSPDIQKAFMKGIYNSDGWSFIDEWATHYAIELCNKDLIYDLKRLVQLNDIKSSNPVMRKRNCAQIYEYSECKNIPKNPIAISHLFYYYMDGKLKKQIKKYNNIISEEFLLEPVRKIEILPEEETWDIQVESSNSNFIANGIVVHNSVLEPARRIYRQLVLQEDAMMIHRIMRAADKRVFKIDIGNIPPAEVDAYMERLMDRSKRVPFYDDQSGEYNMRYNMQNILQDFYIPVRGNDSGTSIENLGGLEYNGIEDVEYLLNKMLASLKIPKSYFGYEDSSLEKSTLAMHDIRFARTIERIQRTVISELTKIAIIHLYSQGYTDEELINFSLSLTNPSTVSEQEKVNLWTQKLALVSSMQQANMMSNNWMYKELFDLPEDEIMHMQEEIIEDKKRAFRLEQIQKGQSDPAKFGYPQNNPPVVGEDGEKENSTTDDTTMPTSIEDLPTEEEVMGESEETRGRPKKGMVYGQDTHPRGRDPIGRKALHGPAFERTPSRKSAMSLEHKSVIEKMPTTKIKIKKQQLIENKSYMDESNIIDENDEN